MARRSSKNRLQEELRERRRKIGRVLVSAALALSCVAIITAAYIKLMDGDTMPVKVVKIDGQFQYLDQEALKILMSQQLKSNFLAIDIDAIRADVQKLDWVDQVTVRRKWPDTLLLNVQEHRPLARWRQGGLVNQRGEWFAGQIEDAHSLPELDGPAGTAALVSGEYIYFRQRLHALGLQATHVRMSGRRSWELGLENGLQLRLGRMKVHDRLQRFMTIYRQIIEKQLDKIESVDMRYTNGFAVRWRPGSDPHNNNKGEHKDV